MERGQYPVPPARRRGGGLRADAGLV